MPDTELMPARGARPVRAQAHFPEGFFSMQADKAMEELSQATAFPASVRLYFLAIARANIWGHASFDDQEINGLLHIRNSARKRAIDTLKSTRVIAPSSDAYCLALSGFLVRRKDRKGETCLSRRHKDVRRRIWLPDYDPEWMALDDWEESLRTKDSRAQVVAVRERTRTRTRIVETETETTRETVIVSGPGRGSSPEVLAALAARREEEARTRRRCARDGCGGWDTGAGLCWDCEQEEAATAEPSRVPVSGRRRVFGAAQASDTDYDGPAY